MGAYGESTIDLLNRVFDAGVEHAVVLMRHSAREFAPNRHDLMNPLTAEGRRLARQLGSRLPRYLTLRGYASPPERCMETAALVLEGHAAKGGPTTRHRPLEALGVFYALDQMKMWKGMQQAGGLVPYLQAWISGQVPGDAMMPADIAARLIFGVLADKLDAPVADRQLDVCVSHDMTLYLLRHCLLQEEVDGPAVAFLDGLVIYRQGDEIRMTSHHGEPRSISEF